MGPSFVYGHVIVDEAQDLSPMEARMLGRRAREGSMTVLGDLAQATGLLAQTDWRETIRHLDAESEPKTFSLTVGYRVPRPIMEFANQLLPAVAPHVPATSRFVSRECGLVCCRSRPPTSCNAPGMKQRVSPRGG